MKSNVSVSPSIEPARPGFPPTLSIPQFTRLVLSGKIVDGRAGGLIFGRTFDEGGILAIYKLGSGYVVQGRIEGGEFAVNWAAAGRNLYRLTAMNAGLTMKEFVALKWQQDPPEVSQLIMTSSQPDDRLVYLHWGQAVVPREATAKDLAELVEMNRSHNSYLHCSWDRIYEISASAIESFNLLIRMSNGRYMRSSNRFSRKIENQWAALALYFVYHNWCRVSPPIRVTPAMEAGLTDHIWDIEELLAKLKIDPN